MELASEPPHTTTNRLSLFKEWLIWFLVLFCSQLLFYLLIAGSGLYTLLLIYPEMYYVYAFFSGLFAGCTQWIYLKRKLPRALFWIPLEMLVFIMIAIGFQLLVKCGQGSLARSSSITERLASICLILIIFLSPRSLLQYFYFRVKKVRVSRSWFLYYFLILVTGILGYFLYDQLKLLLLRRFTFDPTFLTYFDRLLFVLFYTALIALVFASVPFPGVGPKTITKFDYFRLKWFARFLYWFRGLFISGVALNITLFFVVSLEIPIWKPEGIQILPIIIIILTSAYFFLREWQLFRKIAFISKRGFILSALCIPLAFFIGSLLTDVFRIGMIPTILLTIIACFLIGVIQHTGLSRDHFKINVLYFTYFFMSLYLGWGSSILAAMNNGENENLWLVLFYLVLVVIFPVSCALQLSFWVRPTSIPLDYQGDTPPKSLA